MFNRRFLRVKILQALYAYFQDESPNRAKSLKELHHGISRSFELLLFLLKLPVEIHHMAELKNEDKDGKQGKNGTGKTQNRKFLGNRLIAKLASSPRLRKLSAASNISWADQKNSILRFYKIVMASDLYEKYSSSEVSSYADDKKFILALYRELLPDFDLFRQYFHERSIYWDDEDFDYAAYLAVSVVKKTAEDNPIDEVLHPIYSDSEDKDFVNILFNKTITTSKETEKLIQGRTKNWDLERIAIIDTILMKMAITEIMNFNQIPVKVSMNEYIDISKAFSTPQSGGFINGIIDKVVDDLSQQKKIKKVGRGLLE